MSEIKVNKISPKQTCTQLTLGDSGDTIIIPAGATITNNGTATGFGATGAVNWDTTPKTTTVTAVSGNGYFVNTTSGAITVNLPAGVAGSIVAVSDYANTAATNNINIAPNGTDKINGINASYYLNTAGASVTLIYIDSTRGWKDINDSTLNATGITASYISATGGTVLTCGNYKTHVFTGPGSFVVSCAGNFLGSNTVEYLTVAGGGGGGFSNGAGGGAGGFRQNYPSPTTAGLPVTATSYPITVGGGGSGGSSPSSISVSGSPSVFSTITSTGGGRGGNDPNSPSSNGGTGGSGGGSRGGTCASCGSVSRPGGAGNTPPVSPPQGNPGGGGLDGFIYNTQGGGGGGAGAAGADVSPLVAGAGAHNAGSGGIGSPIATTFFGPTAPTYGTPGPAPGRYFAGGGGGSTNSGGSQGSGAAGGGGAGTGVAGTTNTGGGGGSAQAPATTGSGGSGIVVIRYKFQ